MQAKTPRMTTQQAQQLLEAFRQLDDAGKQEFLRALERELGAEYGGQAALKAITEHLQRRP